MADQHLASLFDDLDDATAALILQLQLEDAGFLLDETPAADHSISAVSEGRTILEFHKAELEREEALLRDRHAALQLDPNGASSAFLLGVAAENRPEPVVAPALPPPPERTTDPCVCCSELLFPRERELDIPCHHLYCINCIETLFNQSLVDETLFPPRCCTQPIPVDNLRTILTPEFIVTFEARKQEMETINRTYCSDPRCSIFMRPENIVGDRATCPTCQNSTCVICKPPWHEGVCPADTATQEVLEMARQNGWKRCPGCLSIVSIWTGCNHMVCRCGADWCYQCVARWENNVKTCACPLWEEAILLERANEIVNLEGPQEGQNHEQQLEAAIERVNIHCVHDNGWTFSHGARQCDNCAQGMPTFTMVCDGCDIHWCRRCTRNRAR